MQQGFLFEPETIARGELQNSIGRLDFRTASRKLEEFRSVWPQAKLTWEPELIRIGSKLSASPLDLDSGYKAWTKLESRLGALRVSQSWTALMRRNFYSRLLAANRRLFEELRTAAGRSLGDFYLLAEQPGNARRRYEKEIRQMGDSWELRLRLGNCDFRLAHGRVARSNYHWSFLLGLPQHGWEWIEDTAFLSRLRDADDSEWAFSELCAAGELPSVRFSTRGEFEEFTSRFAAALAGSTGPRRFCLNWIISENKAFCPDSALLQARMQMKILNSELHSRYMQRLG